MIHAQHLNNLINLIKVTMIFIQRVLIQTSMSSSSHKQHQVSSVSATSNQFSRFRVYSLVGNQLSCVFGFRTVNVQVNIKIVLIIVLKLFQMGSLQLGFHQGLFDIGSSQMRWINPCFRWINRVRAVSSLMYLCQLVLYFKS